MIIKTSEKKEREPGTRVRGSHRSHRWCRSCCHWRWRWLWAQWFPSKLKWWGWILVFCWETASPSMISGSVLPGDFHSQPTLVVHEIWRSFLHLHCHLHDHIVVVTSVNILLLFPSPLVFFNVFSFFSYYCYYFLGR